MKVFQKIISVFLAAIFLVSSLGFTANKMVCLKSGKTKLSFINVKDCCPEKESPIPVVKSHCCDITNTFFSLGDLQNAQKVQNSDSFVCQPLYISTLAVENINSSISPAIISFADLPPPLSGRKLLSFISILII